MKREIYHYCDCPKPGKHYKAGKIRLVPLNKFGLCALCNHYPIAFTRKVDHGKTLYAELLNEKIIPPEEVGNYVEEYTLIQ